MFRKIITILLVFVVLSGCTPSTLDTNQVQEPYVVYSWMAGESPVSAERTGEYRNAIDQLQNGFEVTDTGCYWMCDGILLYSDHGSDEVVRLCGRPDCTHTGYSCNAHFHNGMNVCYYDGYLYVTRSSELLKLNLDGTERVSVLKPVELLQKGGLGMHAATVCNGIYYVGLYYLDENGQEQCDYYFTGDWQGDTSLI